MMPGSKGQNAVHACMIGHLNLRPAKHEEVAIYIVNQWIPNVCRIARVAKQRSNSWASFIYFSTRTAPYIPADNEYHSPIYNLWYEQHIFRLYGY